MFTESHLKLWERSVTSDGEHHSYYSNTQINLLHGRSNTEESGARLQYIVLSFEKACALIQHIQWAFDGALLYENSSRIPNADLKTLAAASSRGTFFRLGTIEFPAHPVRCNTNHSSLP